MSTAISIIKYVDSAYVYRRYSDLSDESWRNFKTALKHHRFVIRIVQQYLRKILTAIPRSRWLVSE